MGDLDWSQQAAGGPESRPAPIGDGPAIALDLGGTWFRSAIFAAGDPQDVRVRPAIGRSQHPDASAAELQEGLTKYLLEEVRLRRQEVDRDGELAVGISLGAAINARTGKVIGSAPLWGPDAPPFDLTATLRAAEPDVRWIVLNDVTAAAIAFAAGADAKRAKRVSALVVGTGIALRTIEVDSWHVPTDPRHGLQGEVGHLPAGRLELDGASDLPCDCGALNHLSSFASGPGLARVLAACDGGTTPEDLGARLRDGDRGAMRLLDSATRPIARVLLHQAVLDPECELVALCGGVAEGLGECFRESLLRNLDELGMYGVSEADPAFFRRRLVLAPPGAELSLRGAGHAALRDAELSARSGGAATRTAWTVRAEKPVAYEVRVVPDLLSPGNGALAEAVGGEGAGGNRRLVVIDAKVDELWGEEIRTYFRERGIAIEALPIAASEQEKTMDRVFELARAMHGVGVARRSEPLVVFGGGVLMDVVGLATSLYRRGTPHVRVPTTLIGQVDAGVGIKTAVNFEGRKSRLGSYHAPGSVMLDPAFLRTLERRQISNGLAEIVKMGLIKDAQLFDEVDANAELLLKTSFVCEPGQRIMARAIDSMLAELEPNLWEADLERLVDFGHTFSPGFELRERPPLLHGEAVAVDMALSCALSCLRGWLSEEDLLRSLGVLRRCGLPVTCRSCCAEIAWEALGDTTLHRDGRQRLPLPRAIGNAVFVDDVTFEELEAAVELLDRAADSSTSLVRFR